MFYPHSSVFTVIMVKVTILYFASAREAVGLQSEELNISQTHISEAELLTIITDLHQALTKLEGRLVIAHNERYITGVLELSEGDEIALIPPVSGG